MGDPFPDKPRYKLDRELVGNDPPVRVYPPPRPLDNDEIDRVAAIKALHCQLLPEFNVFVVAMFETGLIEGWRSIVSVQPFDPDSN